MITYLFKLYNLCFFKDRAMLVFLTRTIGYVPIKMHHYLIAFSHRSSTEEYSDNNERMELLGDSVINTVFSDFLYKKFPLKDEGFLTSLRSKIVNRNNLNKIGQKMQLDKFLVKKGMNRLHRDDLFGNTFEALVGAIYLDLGYDKAKYFLLKRVLPNHINIEELVEETDFKSEVFIYAQKNGYPIEFRVVDEKKIKNRNYYVIDLLINEEVVSTGEGFNKKIAEQTASRKAMEQFQ